MSFRQQAGIPCQISYVPEAFWELPGVPWMEATTVRRTEVPNLILDLAIPKLDELVYVKPTRGLYGYDCILWSWMKGCPVSIVVELDLTYLIFHMFFPIRLRI
ncbi:hypothetical protein HAX54_019679 [Datura stramonium]|uniref:Uncharacterized protein n=1 Tax=Datura stramonium TaxID=4076 RepID=A0ABS8UQD8_DATST|nr:hypothetical protein [Datura stramonium]